MTDNIKLLLRITGICALLCLIVQLLITIWLYNFLVKLGEIDILIFSALPWATLWMFTTIGGFLQWRIIVIIITLLSPIIINNSLMELKTLGQTALLYILPNIEGFANLTVVAISMVTLVFIIKERKYFSQ